MGQLPTELSELPSYLVYLLRNPTFNLTAALILYAAIAVFLLLIMVLGIMLLTRGSKSRGDVKPSSAEEDEEFAQLPAGEIFEGRDEGEAAQSTPRTRPARRRRVLPASRQARRAWSAVGVMLLLVAWVAAGYSTSRTSLCKGCHWPSAQHASAPDGTDMHAAVDCVLCHESGGAVGRYITGVPARIVHFLDAESSKPPHEYGATTTEACSRCHEGELVGVVSDDARALKMSHEAALAASAACVDCHALRAGVVGTHNAGMTPCMRCHDSTSESAECTVCHEGQAAFAVRPRTTSFRDVQITDVSCGGCHNEAEQCDPCHGLRMPHSKEFMLYAHSRSGVVDFWFNGGQTCSKCHTASRRPCQQCHSTLLGGAHGQGTNWLADTHKGAQVKACDTCHRDYGYSATRDFCQDVCHTPAAIAESPR